MQTTQLPLHYKNIHKSVVKDILAWYNKAGRVFPWRLSTTELHAGTHGVTLHDPYMILVAEVMLQQTQTARVIAKLPEFLALFPDVVALAAAPRNRLITAWQGMGYNSRALRLQDAARAIQQQHKGVFPETVHELQALPGIGPYTAAAVACFAVGQHVAVIDVNVQRVLSRIFYKCHSQTQVMSEREIRTVAEDIIPKGKAYHWHQALMDIGATICTARTLLCSQCPVATHCLSANPPALPLYNGANAKKEEPSLRGIPRRLWRGKVVELLRAGKEVYQISVVIDDILGRDVFGAPNITERKMMVSIIEQLIRDGLAVMANNGVQEGGLEEWNYIGLPD